jgi:hypothetical protein
MARIYDTAAAPLHGKGSFAQVWRPEAAAGRMNRWVASTTSTSR